MCSRPTLPFPGEGLGRPLCTSAQRHCRPRFKPPRRPSDGRASPTSSVRTGATPTASRLFCAALSQTRFLPHGGLSPRRETCRNWIAGKRADQRESRQREHDPRQPLPGCVSRLQANRESVTGAVTPLGLRGRGQVPTQDAGRRGRCVRSRDLGPTELRGHYLTQHCLPSLPSGLRRGGSQAGVRAQGCWRLCPQKGRIPGQGKGWGRWGQVWGAVRGAVCL